jgi:hypothetical protein
MDGFVASLLAMTAGVSAGGVLPRRFHSTILV